MQQRRKVVIDQTAAQQQKATAAQKKGRGLGEAAMLTAGRSVDFVEFLGKAVYRDVGRPVVNWLTTPAYEHLGGALGFLHEKVEKPVGGAIALSMAVPMPGEQEIEKQFRATGSLRAALENTKFPWGVQGALEQAVWAPTVLISPATIAGRLGAGRSAAALAQAPRFLPHPLEPFSKAWRQHFNELLDFSPRVGEATLRRELSKLGIGDAHIEGFLRKIHSGAGAVDLENQLRLYKTYEQDAAEVATRTGSAVQQMLRRVYNGSEKIGLDGILNLSTRLPRAGQQALLDREALMHSRDPWIFRTAELVQQQFSQLFKTLPAPRTVTEAASYLQQVAEHQTATPAQRRILHLMDIFEYPEEYALNRAQGNWLRQVEIMWDDQLFLDKAFGASVDGVVRGYIPHAWEVPSTLVDKAGALTATGRRLILGADRPFQQARGFMHGRKAFANNLLPRADVKELRDLVMLRGAQSSRARADARFLRTISALDKEGQRSIRHIIENQSAFEQHALGRLLVGGTWATRKMRLSLDAAVAGVQAIGRVVDVLGDPVGTVKSVTMALHFSMHPAAYRQWAVANADRIAAASRDGLQVGTKMRETIMEAPARTLNIGRVPVVGPVAQGISRGLDVINEAQFGRALNVLKLDSYMMNKEVLMKGSAINRLLGTADGLSEAAAGRAAAAHGNNLFGGLSAARLAETATRKDFQRLLLLTPDLLRATSSVFLKAVTPTAEGMLARKFLLKAFTVYAGMTELVTYTTTGTHANLVNPRQGDWMLARTPGRTYNFLGRFRTYARAILAPDETLVRWAKGRESIPISVGAGLLTNKTFFGEAIRSKEGWQGAVEQLSFAATEGGMPLPIEQTIGDLRRAAVTPDTVLLNVMGVSSFAVDRDQRRILSAQAEGAIAAGAPEGEVRALVADGKSPLLIKDSEGRMLLTTAERNSIIDSIVAATGLGEETVRRLGRTEQKESLEVQRAERRERTDTMLSMSDSITQAKRKAMEWIEDSIGTDEVPSLADARLKVTAVRQAARAKRVEVASEFADLFGEWQKDPRWLEQRNQKDLLFDAIGEKLFGDTVLWDGTIDYAKQEENTAALHQWLKGMGIDADATIREFFDQYGKEGTALERELDEVTQVTLKPYWEVARDALEAEDEALFLQYIRMSPSVEQRAWVVEHPRIHAAIRIVQQRRRLLRLLNPEVDAALQTWYGYQPVSRLVSLGRSTPRQSRWASLVPQFSFAAGKLSRPASTFLQ